MQIDHYEVLGLPSGEEGAKLSDKEIAKAYRQRALELHPDKRRDDPDADSKFQRLKSSYEILKDEKARQLFNDLLRVQNVKRQRHSQFDSKRRKMMSDLEERERASFAPDPIAKAREEEERIAKKLKEEIARIRAMRSKKNMGAATTSSEVKTESATSSVFLDRERVLKVSWVGSVEDYNAQRLRELFGAFGDVEDVIIQPKGFKKKRTSSVLVVMTTKDAAVAAMGNVCGDISNPLLVLPLKGMPDEFPSMPFPKKSNEAGAPELNNPVGAGFQAKEDSILEKLRKAAEKQKSRS